MKIKFLGRPLTSERVKNMWVLFNMYQGRGSGLLDQLRLQQYLTLGAAFVILFPRIPKLALIPLGLFFIIFTTYLGWYDKAKLKLWQRELEKQSTHVNPYNIRIEKKLDKLIRLMKKEKRTK